MAVYFYILSSLPLGFSSRMN
uniref:Uncharacterized protein n=1 Tax=Rhizophora mucronata TaxID=61149 RepID=A0A2P2P092_RHIMU